MKQVVVLPLAKSFSVKEYMKNMSPFKGIYTVLLLLGDIFGVEIFFSVEPSTLGNDNSTHEF